MSATKRLMRTKVWFPRPDRMVEETIRFCIPCQCNVPENTRAPLQMTPLPENVWEHLNLDVLGPLPDGSYLFVVVDQYSRYSVVEIINSTAAGTVIPVLDKILAAYGNVLSCCSDNGPSFQSDSWSKYAAYMGSKHRKIIPLWPSAHSTVERVNQSILKSIRAAHAEGKS